MLWVKAVTFAEGTIGEGDRRLTMRSRTETMSYRRMRPCGKKGKEKVTKCDVGEERGKEWKILQETSRAAWQPKGSVSVSL